MQFQTEHSQDRKQFAGAKFAHASALEARERLLGDASLSRNDTLLQAEGLTPGRYRRAEFLNGLNLMYTSNKRIFIIIMTYI